LRRGAACQGKRCSGDKDADDSHVMPPLLLTCAPIISLVDTDNILCDSVVDANIPPRGATRSGVGGRLEDG